MAHDDDRRTSITEHGTHLTVEDTSHGSPWLSLDIDALLVEGHMSLHVRHIIRTKTVHDTIAASNGEWQSATIALEIATQLAIYRRNGILSLRLLCALLGLSFQSAFLSSLLLVGLSQFLLASLSVCLGLALCLKSCTFCLTGSTLCCCLGFSILLRSCSPGLSLSLLFLGFQRRASSRSSPLTSIAT